MAFQTVFKRYELKYLITADQRDEVLKAMDGFMALDKYGKTTIRNLYFDTDSYLLIRRSIEKPVYKEKLRVRSYQKANDDSTVFVELKKKYKSEVFKRRISMPYLDAMTFLLKNGELTENTQISKEIDYFVKFYENLHPTVFLSYDRKAYFSKDKSDFRVTFDSNVLVRLNDLSLMSEAYGTPILPDGKILMEIKCSGGIPLWMTDALSRGHIYKTSFSKYGTAYQNLILPKILNGGSL